MNEWRQQQQAKYAEIVKNNPEAVKAAVEEFKKVARARCNPPKHKKIKPVRIRFEGKFLETFSQKTIWKRLGDASNALTLMIESAIPFRHTYRPGEKNYHFNGKYYTYDERDAIIQAAKKIIKEKVIEFVEVDG